MNYIYNKYIVKFMDLSAKIVVATSILNAIYKVGESKEIHSVIYDSVYNSTFDGDDGSLINPALSVVTHTLPTVMGYSG